MQWQRHPALKPANAARLRASCGNLRPGRYAPAAAPAKLEAESRPSLLHLVKPDPAGVVNDEPPARRLALALGGASSVWDDEKAARELAGEFDLVVACNDIGTQYPGITHWVTLHPDKMAGWLVQRLKNGHPLTGFEIVTHRQHPKKYRMTGDWGGSSGLLAVKVALEAGATHVICAGIPMTATPHFFSKPNWRFAENHRNGWNRRKDGLTRVRSMSGWTRQLLGAPSADWLGVDHGKTANTTTAGAAGT